MTPVFFALGPHDAKKARQHRPSCTAPPHVLLDPRLAVAGTATNDNRGRTGRG
jgi:hypothetical protein